MSALKPGERLTSLHGLALTVGRLLGEGGQGTVYEVHSEGGGAYALKWYHRPHAADLKAYEEQRRALKGGEVGVPLVLIERAPPDRRFLWPMDYVEQRMRDSLGEYLGYGYVMGLRPEGYASIEELVLGRVRFSRDQGGPLRALCTAAIGIADCLRVLHLEGLCYKDINYGGPFFQPVTGEVLICDNDNVRVNKTPGTIYMPEFAAPEVNLGKADCTTRTDDHSLAVLLFFMFCRGNPLEGRREVNINVFENNAKRRTFGAEPIFVFDPSDDSNRPVPGLQDAVIKNWARLPTFIRDHFVQVFTEGLRDPRRRLTDTQWLKAFWRLRDALFPCDRCGLEGFADLGRLRPGATTLKCGFCGHTNPMPPRLELGGTVVLLTPRARLYPHHLGALSDFSAPAVAEMAQDPRNPSRWGLRNTGTRNWSYTAADGTTRDVQPGSSLVLTNGREVNFGGKKGHIRAS